MGVVLLPSLGAPARPSDIHGLGDELDVYDDGLGHRILLVEAAALVGTPLQSVIGGGNTARFQGGSGMMVHVVMLPSSMLGQRARKEQQGKDSEQYEGHFAAKNESGGDGCTCLACRESEE